MSGSSESGHGSQFMSTRPKSEGEGEYFHAFTGVRASSHDWYSGVCGRPTHRPRVCPCFGAWVLPGLPRILLTANCVRDLSQRALLVGIGLYIRPTAQAKQKFLDAVSYINIGQIGQCITPHSPTPERLTISLLERKDEAPQCRYADGTRAWPTTL
jgi:hypothetical protein